MLRKELENLYKSNIAKIKAVRDAFPEYGLKGLFLISVPDRYQDATKRVMIIGQ